MKILIDGKEIKVPEFIANAERKERKQFDAFLKELLEVQAQRIRKAEGKLNDMNPFFDFLNTYGRRG